MREEELFGPVATWLEGQGYRVSSEVRDCDIVAQKPDDPDELIIVELKTRMSLDLVNQGVRRKEITDAVYLAVPLHGAKATLRNSRALLQTLRRLELGLIYVRFLRSGIRIELVVHPGEFSPRRRHRRRAAIIREIDHRYGEFNRGGQPSTTRRFSAYRQRALLTAAILREKERATPQHIRLAGGPKECGRILSANHYGWFDRIERGWYRLSPEGIHAVEEYGDVVSFIKRE